MGAVVPPTEACRSGCSMPYASSTEAETALLTGAVGEGPGIELLMWHLEMDLPDPEDVLANPDAFEVPERHDRAHAVLSSVCLLYTSPSPRDS